ncbi:tyrosine-type recombinase/integrase [Chloroflexota bacterium]
MELRQKTNDELFTLYEGELAFHHRSTRSIHEAKRVLNHFHNYVGEFPPTPELAKSFLSQYKDRKPTTIARYAAILKVFFKWYGEELAIKIRIPKILPSYVDKSKIDKLLEAMKSKRSHKETIGRDLLLIDLAIHTGLRRSELANLRVGDIDVERRVLVVRHGKGAKDRIIPLSEITTDKLVEYIKNKDEDNSLLGLTPASISGKIRAFANKAGVDIHTHSLRDYFATSLSEKGATIREIQSLLGHANLTHTERYTLHTDKHLREAVGLLDEDKPDTEEQETIEAIRKRQVII